MVSKLSMIVLHIYFIYAVLEQLLLGSFLCVGPVQLIDLAYLLHRQLEVCCVEEYSPQTQTYGQGHEAYSLLRIQLSLDSVDGQIMYVLLSLNIFLHICCDYVIADGIRRGLDQVSLCESVNTLKP